MYRRKLMMLLLGGALTAAPALRAQQKAMPVIGFLSGTSPTPNAPNLAAFHQGLSETGYIDGRMWRSNTAGRRDAMIGCPPWPPTSSAARSI
jgi:hypothetical protein